MSLAITVVIPAYNAAAFIGDAVHSVFTQTRLPEEVIIIDDGSTDATPQILESIGKNVPPGTSLRIIHQQNAGVMAARNRGIAEAHGDWIAFLDADDAWFPEKLHRQTKLLETLNTPALLCCGMVTFWRDLPAPTTILCETLPTQVSTEQLLQRNYIGTSTVLLPKASLVAVGGFSAHYNHAEDWAVWLRIAASVLPIWRMTEQLGAYRMTPNALGTRNPGYLRDVEIRIIKDFVREHDLHIPKRVVRQALAGNHIRTAFNYDSIQRFGDAAIEIMHSIATWPMTLPEYSNGKRLYRLHLLCRLLWNYVNSAQLTVMHASVRDQ